jgi:integrase
MSVHGPYAGRGKAYKVAWRDGTQRSEWFAGEAEAKRFDGLSKEAKAAWLAAAQEPSPAAAADEISAGVELPEGVFAYETGAGTRYRFNAGGTTPRGFKTPEAALIEKGRFEERRNRGQVAIGRTRFEPTWERYLAYKRPRISEGAYDNLERDGRNHILPFFGTRQLQAVDGTVVETWMEQFTEDVEDGKRAPKTVNNWRAHVSAFFEWCRSRPDIPVVSNPCEFVEPLPVREEEMTFFTLQQIPVYLECCSAGFRLLAWFLVQTGARVSEAVAVRVVDLDLDNHVVRIYRQRDRKRGAVATKPTKSTGKFRSVSLGPELVQALRDLLALRAEHGIEDGGWLFLCPPPTRGRYARRTEPCATWESRTGCSPCGALQGGA